MVRDEFAGPRSKLPWKSIKVPQQPSPEGCVGAGPGLAARPMVHPSIILHRAGQHGQPFLQNGTSAVMGIAQVKENPSILASLGRWLVPTSPQGGQSQLQLSEQSPVPPARRRCHTGQKSCAARDP